QYVLWASDQQKNRGRPISVVGTSLRAQEMTRRQALGPGIILEGRLGHGWGYISSPSPNPPSLAKSEARLPLILQRKGLSWTQRWQQRVLGVRLTRSVS